MPEWIITKHLLVVCSRKNNLLWVSLGSKVRMP